jgi:hypothetical protein
LRKWSRKFAISLKSLNNNASISFRLKDVITLAFIVVLFFAGLDTYRINKDMGFGSHPLDESSFQILSWLKRYDPGLYYADLGGALYFWNWAPASYQYQIPVINNNQIERLASSDVQHIETSPFYATAKYQILQSDQTPTEGAELVHDFTAYQLYYYPNALPFAFTAENTLLDSGSTLDSTSVQSAAATYTSLNRIKVVATLTGADSHLIVLVSDYPGWKVSVDGKPAKLKPVNFYLGTDALPGKHTYVFTFDPPLYRIGLIISLVSFLAAVGLLLSEFTPLHRWIHFLRTRRSEGA